MEVITRMQHPPGNAKHRVGELWFAGDWACAHGDLETLGYVARRLADLMPEPLHCELAALAELCQREPDRATEAWVRLKALVQASAGRSTP